MGKVDGIVSVSNYIILVKYQQIDIVCMRMHEKSVNKPIFKLNHKPEFMRGKKAFVDAVSFWRNESSVDVSLINRNQRFFPVSSKHFGN